LLCSIDMEEANDAKEEKRRSQATFGKDADSIRVICRFRPPKAVEVEMYGQSTKLENFIIDESRGTVSVEMDFERKSFAYDKVVCVCVSINEELGFRT
jgi:hypothetical protein